MRVYVENPAESTKKLLKLVSWFHNASGCKINWDQLDIYLVATNKYKLKLKINAMYSSVKNMKYLGIILTKDVLVLYAKNSKQWRPKLNEI